MNKTIKMPTSKKTVLLSPIDWMMPRSYITQIICFSSSNPQSYHQFLRNGFVGMLVDVSYLTYEVVEGSSPKGSVMLRESHQSLDDLFQVKDLSATINYQSLKTAQFSPSALDGLNEYHTDLLHTAGQRPVFRATGLLVQNGYLLCVSIHHSTTDITGFGGLLKIWASHCRTGGSNSIGFTDRWLDRAQLLKMSAEISAGCPELLHIREPAEITSKPETLETDDLKSEIFIFQAQKLQKLKAEVNKLLPSGEIPWVSTSDILTAVLWSAIIFAELQEYVNHTLSPAYKTQGTRSIRIPVNFRSHYRPPLPREYLGAAFGISLATAKIIDLETIATAFDDFKFLSALARVAAAIRRAINLVNEGERVRRAIEFLAAQKDLRDIELGPSNSCPSIVSWADEGIYDLGWGPEIGRCDAVRLPGLKRKRWPIVLPRHHSNLEVFVRLEKRQMDILKDVWVVRMLRDVL